MQLEVADAVTTRPEITLSQVEIQQLTGYRRPGKQLQELLRRGFYRAGRSCPTGEVIRNGSGRS